MTALPDKLLTPQEVADLLKITLAQVHQLAHDYGWSSVRKGKKVWYKQKSLDRYLGEVDRYDQMMGRMTDERLG